MTGDYPHKWPVTRKMFPFDDVIMYIIVLDAQFSTKPTYRKTSNIRRNSLGNKIVDNSDVAGASPVGAAPTTSSFST